MKTGPKPRPLAERFWPKVDKENGKVPSHMPHLGPCWNWTASLDHAGYGKIGMGSLSDNSHRWEPAHRAAWYLSTGDWPHLWVLHHCDNPACVRPSHLFLGTQADNFRDMVEKHRSLHKLTAADVLAIRSSRESQSVLGRRYGIYPTAISKIKLRQRWQHLPEGASP